MRRGARSFAVACVAALAVLLSAIPKASWAQSASATVRMTVTDVVNLTLSTQTTNLTGTPFTAAEFNAGRRTGIVGPTLTVKANRAWKISIKGAAWTGTGNNAKPVSELQWSRDNATYTGLTTTLAQILPASGNGAATNGTVQSMFYRWLLHTGTDTRGTYQMVVTYTLSAP